MSNKVKSSNPGQACVNCHFLRLVLLEMLAENHKSMDVEVSVYYREHYKKKDYDYETDGPHIMLGLGCSEGCWREEVDPNKYKDTDWKNLPEKKANYLAEKDHANFIKERHGRIVEKDRIDCLKFFEYEKGMKLDMAREHRDENGDYEFILSGENWTVSYEGKTINFRSSKGLQYIHYLLENPDNEITALNLVREMEKSSPTKDVVYKNLNKNQLEGQLIEEGLALTSPNAIGEIVDSDAIKNYRGHKEKLERELSDAEELSNDEEAAKIKEEIEQVAKQLTAGLNKRGQLRKIPHEAEKARKAVSKAINNSLCKIKDDTNGHPAFWKHLNSSLTIGLICSYKPEKPIPWNL